MLYDASLVGCDSYASSFHWCKPLTRPPRERRRAYSQAFSVNSHRRIRGEKAGNFFARTT